MKAEGDAIELVLNAMRTHSSNSRLCEAGCGALRNITANNGKQIEAQTERNDFQNITANSKVKAGKEGAIKVILDAMRTYSNNSMVCYNGCGALCNIASNGKQIEAQTE